MTQQDKINVGDTVTVHFFQSEDYFANCVVLYIPAQAGECWQFKTKEGYIVYAQSFSYVLKNTKESKYARPL
ncbi:MAG: hypothetical protein BV459_00530 [Thermoplasmata archaeon M11B2D]|nr:MAG: hypothetical protein BV459_00530 [Thermoplasmata archaeon M11B2D]